MPSLSSADSSRQPRPGPSSEESQSIRCVDLAAAQLEFAWDRALLPGPKKINVSYQQYLREDAFDSVTEESAYWIGFLMADGCICPVKTGQTGISINISAKDEACVHRFRRFIGSRHKIGRHQPKRGNELVRLRIYSDRIAGALARYGVVPRKSQTAKVYILDKNRDFWRGVIDGDGYLTFRSNTGCLGLVGSRYLVEQFREFILGICPDFKRPVLRHASIYRLELRSVHAIAVAATLYSDCVFAMPRKLDLARAVMASSVYDGPTGRFRNLTLEKLESLFRELGTLGAVAESLGTTRHAITKLKSRLRKAKDKGSGV
jgi:hypothetical protein